MNAADAAEPGERRRRRAALAERLLAQAADIAPAIDWQTLDSAPPWLSLPATALATLARRLGALLCAPALRLWIDRPRLAAAHAAVGAPFLQAVLAQPDGPALATQLQLAAADQVGALLQSSGVAVLLATLPPGTLECAAVAMLPPAAALDVAPQAAVELVAHEQALAEEASRAERRAAPKPVLSPVEGPARVPSGDRPTYSSDEGLS